ncbi:hypothetical protein RJ639_045744 [Escallonia herrerae]|uniref:VQ domain-containing protein n=1 Tax=Escallonia herrerae TaxID=1293975 RepID=A0AA88W723_9ASTE|nr:hypothetical protein RJ639_045744 [Escallonia herrerae]
MASCNPNNHNSNVSSPDNSNTTFVQADPSTFRAVVQRLTGAAHDQSTPKLPVTVPARIAAGKSASGSEMGPRRSPFKLHERRPQSARKLEIVTLNNAGFGPSGSSSARQRGFFGFGGGEVVMGSPVSPLDLFARGSPRTPMSPMEQEEKAIAEKGFYLHPSPLSTPRGGSEPELLPLFPLQSPRDHESSSSC